MQRNYANMGTFQYSCHALMLVCGVGAIVTLILGVSELFNVYKFESADYVLLAVLFGIAGNIFKSFSEITK